MNCPDCDAEFLAILRLEGCPECGWSPEHGYRCLHCGDVFPEPDGERMIEHLFDEHGGIASFVEHDPADLED